MKKKKKNEVVLTCEFCAYFRDRKNTIDGTLCKFARKMIEPDTKMCDFFIPYPKIFCHKDNCWMDIKVCCHKIKTKKRCSRCNLKDIIIKLSEMSVSRVFKKLNRKEK